MRLKTQPFKNRSTTPEQSVSQIVETLHKNVEVLASPGSGKTHTLILRLEHLLHLGVLPQQILVLSFSNEAVRELRRRMDTLSTPMCPPIANAGKSTSERSAIQKTVTPVDFSGIQVCTAHAFARSLIPKSFTLLSDKTRRDLLEKSIQSVMRDARKKALWPDALLAVRQRRRKQLRELREPQNVRSLLELFDYARAAGQPISEALTIGAYEHLATCRKVVEAIRRRYLKTKQGNASMDFGDMLEQATTRITRGRAKTPFMHVLVDEFQDCSAAQTQLLVALANASQPASIMVFGDPMQSLYGFAGAEYRGLPEYIKPVERLRLPVSRRLSAPVAALASAVAQHSKLAAIQTDHDGSRPVLIIDESQTQQASHVLADVQRLMAKGVATEDIAVLARTKATLNAVEAALLAADIPTDRIGQNRSQQHVLAVLKLERWLERWISSESPIDVRKVAGLVIDRPVDVTACEKEARQLMSARIPTSLEGRYMLCSKAYLRLLGGMRANTEIQADVNRWAPICRNYADARAMRAAIKLMDTGAVVTGTIHAAKGREWMHVLVVGVTDGLLPIYMAKDDALLAEERNALYVAITRAKDGLRLYHAPVNHARTRQHFETLSRFMRVKTVHKLLDQEQAIDVICN